MEITDEAKLIITEALDSNDCDCLLITQLESCCGTSLNFGLAKLNEDDKSVSINGISVMMDSQTQERAKEVTLTAEDGELVIDDDAPSCCC